MNFNLNYEGFEKYLNKKYDNFTGIHYVFKFENGYGASVIKGPFTYGGPQDLWELAVLSFGRDDECSLEYGTEITDDVIGYQTNEEILDLLNRIKELKEPVHIES